MVSSRCEIGFTGRSTGVISALAVIVWKSTTVERR
jgi:hypothetical protein